MLRVALHDLIALDVLQVVHENLLRQHIDQLLNIGAHHFLIICVENEFAEIAVREGRHEELHVELISAKKYTRLETVGDMRDNYLKNIDAS